MAARELGNPLGNALASSNKKSQKPKYAFITLKTPGAGTWNPIPGYTWMRVIAVGPGSGYGGGGGGCAATDIIPINSVSYFIGAGSTSTPANDTTAQVAGYYLVGGRSTGRVNGGTASGGYTNFSGGNATADGNGNYYGGGSGGTTSTGGTGPYNTTGSTTGDGGPSGGSYIYGGAGIGSNTSSSSCGYQKEWGKLVSSTMNGGWPGGGGGYNGATGLGGTGGDGGIIIELW